MKNKYITWHNKEHAETLKNDCLHFSNIFFSVKTNYNIIKIQSIVKTNHKNIKLSVIAYIAFGKLHCVEKFPTLGYFDVLSLV